MIGASDNDIGIILNALLIDFQSFCVLLLVLE